MACTATQALAEEPACFNARDRWKSSMIESSDAIPIHPLTQAECEAGLDKSHGALAVGLAAASKFKGKAGDMLLVPNATTGAVDRVLLGLGSAATANAPGPADCWAYAALPPTLPAGAYKLVLPAGADGFAAVLGWALGCYSFDRYKRVEDKEGKPIPPRVQAQLVWPEGVDRDSVSAIAACFFWARDMITTPAEDLGPGHLAQEAAAMAASHQGATCTVLRGDELLDKNYPAIHTVGRAAARPPALIDIRWQPAGVADASALPRLSLVGKGVCFDSGGLDLKSAAGMKLMKKDMGGAALMLAVAHAVMSHSLPVRLRLMVPAVENAVAGNAYRPLDVLRTRAGITVENGNTDAEGRLILSDALYEASTEEPDLLLDAATLTGAARTALGPDLPAVFTNCDDTWQQFNAAAVSQGEGIWRLPLHSAYRKMIDSKVADLSSTGGEGAQGGAILAALFLAEFVKKAPRWVHIDTAAYVSGGTTGPGRPEGGEVQAFRALWAWLRARYAAPQ